MSEETLFLKKRHAEYSTIILGKHVDFHNRYFVTVGRRLPFLFAFGFGLWAI
jgi:hypothetical protein